MAEIGELIAGRYRLVDRIAVGGMGVVWEGWDELLARKVAVKQVLTQPGLSEADAMLARNRVIREARITARLHHPSAVTIYDVVDHGDYPCLIMQFVPSQSLGALLRERGTLPTGQVARIGADLAGALRAAHEVGIVHRDVKPGNVLITDDGSAKLTDFGISHAAGDVTLTSTGMVSGTPAYLAPEVARGGTSGFAADVFSLGATMYAALEGTPPFGLDTNPMAVLHRVASGQLIPPQRSGELTPLLLAMMAADPAARPTMAEVSRTLSRPVIDNPPARPAPPARGTAQTVPVSRSELAAALNSGTAVQVPATAQPVRPARAAQRPVQPSPAAPGPVQPNPAPSSPAQPAQSSRAQPSSGKADGAEPNRSGTAALAELMSGPPTGSPKSAASSSRRRPVAIAAVVVVLAALLTTGYLLISSRDSGQSSVAVTASGADVSTAQPAETVPSTSAEEPPATSAEEPPATSAEEPSATSEEESTTSAAATPSEPAAEPAATALAAAVTDYYALMPGNTEAGWALLTPNFQSGIARDREYYNSFWAGVERVSVTDVVGTPPGTVEATVTYQFADGTVSVERTAYQLVQEGAGFKIDNSSVLSG